MPCNGKSYLFKSSIGVFGFSCLFIIDWLFRWINSWTLFEIMISATSFVRYKRKVVWTVTGYGWSTTWLQWTICEIRHLNNLLLRYFFISRFIINFIRRDWLPHRTAITQQHITFIELQSALENLQSTLMNLQSALENLQSALMNLQSTLENLQSAL